MLPSGDAAFTVRAIYGGSEWVGSSFVDVAAFDALLPEALDARVYVSGDDGAVRAAAQAYPTGKVLDKEEFFDAASAQVDQLLGIVYAMLALAVAIALLGIANTLALSIFERTRELGLLRAVGMTRRQVRATIRGEAVIVDAVRHQPGSGGRGVVRLGRGAWPRGRGRHDPDLPRGPAPRDRGARRPGRDGGRRAPGPPGSAVEGPVRAGGDLTRALAGDPRRPGLRLGRTPRTPAGVAQAGSHRSSPQADDPPPPVTGSSSLAESTSPPHPPSPPPHPQETS